MADAILSYVQKIQDELDAREVEVENLKKGATLRTAQVKKREQQAQEKEVQLAEWEKVLNRKYEEVSRLENAKLMELRSQENHEKTIQKRKEVEVLLKEANEKLAEAKMLRDEVLKRELAVTEREKKTREEVRIEIAQGFLKNITGK